MRPSDPPTARMTLLGGFELAVDGSAVSLPAHAQRLLAFVGLRGRPSRALASGTLWPEVSDRHALGSLRSTLWRIQRVSPGLIEPTRDVVALGPHVTVDARELRAFAHSLLARPREDSATRLSGEATDDELLPGWYDDWVLAERERLQQLRLHALESCAAFLFERGRYAVALEAAQAAARLEPLRESTHRLVLRIHLCEGNRAEAIRAYEAYRLLLDHEMGLEPSRQTRELLAVAD